MATRNLCVILGWDKEPIPGERWFFCEQNEVLIERIFDEAETAKRAQLDPSIGEGVYRCVVGTVADRDAWEHTQQHLGRKTSEWSDVSFAVLRERYRVRKRLEDLKQQIELGWEPRDAATLLDELLQFVNSGLKLAEWLEEKR